MDGSLKEVYLYPHIADKPPFTVNAPGCEAVEGETIPRRNAQYAGKLLSEPEEGTSTVYDIITRGTRVFGDAKCVGSRKLLKTHNETRKVKKVVNGQEQEMDKKWTYYEMSGYSYLSFREYEQLILQIGAGFRKLGIKSSDKVFMFAATSAHWLATAHGATSQSIPFVTAYDTLGEEAIKHSLRATSPKVLFFDPQLIATVKNALKDNTSVRFLVYNDDYEMKLSDTDELKKTHGNIQVISFQQLRKLGEDNFLGPAPPKPEDLCCIMYTSGSTGTPKGVMLTHKNIVSAVAGINAIVGPYIGPKDALMAYLPLAHIFEFVVENTAIYWGSVLGYGTSKTLSDMSMKNCKGDIREFRPTVMVGVPAVWEGIRKGIVAKVEQQGFLKKKAFWAALAAKSWMLKNGLPGWGLFDKAVFGAVREATGGRMRACANGAGPIAQDTQRFISMVIAPMIGGYGMTETLGMGALGSPMRWTDEAIGDIPACIEVKLVDFPDAGYFSHNNPPQGEIWIRGNSVMKGYHLDPQQTEENLTPDGWLKTGDIGEWDKNGHLKIIDRKKNLVKTLNGEYIALEKLESIYRSSAIVSNICVYASPSHAKPIAIIMPAEAALRELAARNSFAHDVPLGDLIDNEKFQGIVLKEIQAAGRRGGLAGIEIVSGVLMVHDEWTPQNGLLTSAMKLARRHVVEMYKEDIDEVYARDD